MIDIIATAVCYNIYIVLYNNFIDMQMLTEHASKSIKLSMVYEGIAKTNKFRNIRRFINRRLDSKSLVIPTLGNLEASSLSLLITSDLTYVALVMKKTNTK